MPTYRPRTADDTAATLPPLGLTHGRYTLCVCTLEPRKRVDSLLAAYARLPSVLRAAYPSIYQGFGLPVAEAMASAVPVITSNSSCRPEVAGGAALLIDPDDSEAFCRSLEQGLTDRAWREQARRRGAAVAAAYTWDACANGTLEVYRRVAAAGLA